MTGMLLLRFLFILGDPIMIQSQVGDLAIGFPGDLFQEPKITTQIQSGLTTTMLVTVVGKDQAKTRGGARVDIRFEPWDEIYHVVVWHHDGVRETLELASQDKLYQWLSSGKIRVVPQKTAPRYLVVLQVLPFSKTEQVETQKWFSRTLAGNQQGRGYMLDLIFAASIKRKTSRKYQWAVQAP